jgi:hypothetical protein
MSTTQCQIVKRKRKESLALRRLRGKDWLRRPRRKLKLLREKRRPLCPWRPESVIK